MWFFKKKTEKYKTKTDKKINTKNNQDNKKSSDIQTKVDVISKDTSTKKLNKTLKTTDNYYFNASVTNDGDGSKDNPWKTINQLNFNKITNGSTVYISNGNYNVDNIDVNIDVNIIGNLNILEYCRENGADRILFAQSFGDIKDYGEENQNYDTGDCHDVCLGNVRMWRES